MNEHEIASEIASQGWDWKGLAIGAVTVITGLLAWIGNKQVDRIDAHDTRIDDLEAKTVRKEDLTALRLEIKEDITSMEGRVQSSIQIGFNHVAERIGDIKKDSDAAHRRIDEMVMKQK